MSPQPKVVGHSARFWGGPSVPTPDLIMLEPFPFLLGLLKRVRSDHAPGRAQARRHSTTKGGNYPLCYLPL